MKSSNRGVWITWENQRRNRGISSALGWDLYEITYKGSKTLRYVKSIFKTLIIIIKNKPKYLAVQNPSIILSLVAILLRNIFKYKCIVDAHNAGLFPFDNKYKALNKISKYIQYQADVTLVSNLYLSYIVRENNGTPFVLPDKIPDTPENIQAYNLDGDFNFAFICSFASDEPYLEVIEAAQLISNKIHIYITGKYDGKLMECSVPSNVKLLGYVPDQDYWSLISSVDGIIVLTKRENCLVCGAYEAISLGKPMILSKTRAIMEYFTSGCVYTNPNVIDIKMAITNLINNKNELQKQINKLEEQLRLDWENIFTNFIKCITAI